MYNLAYTVSSPKPTNRSELFIFFSFFLSFSIYLLQSCRLLLSCKFMLFRGLLFLLPSQITISFVLIKLKN